MSWQDYVDFILDKGNVEDCMIVDSTDGFIWAATPNFQLQNYKTMIIKEDGSEVEEDVSESSMSSLCMCNMLTHPSYDPLNGTIIFRSVCTLKMLLSHHLLKGHSSTHPNTPSTNDGLLF